MLLPLFLAASALCGVEDPEKLRILTYNIHHGEGSDGQFDLDRIVEIIRAQAPHVVCLQEVDRGLPRTQHLDLPALLAQKLDMEVRFHSNYNIDGGEYGNATLTQLPILATEHQPLPRHEDREPRGVLRLTLQWQHQEIDVYNTHLGLVPEERLAQAHALLAMLGNRPAILCGDLNETPSAPAVNLLKNRLTDAAPPPDGPTGTIPATTPQRRIDYILHSPHFASKEAQIIQAPPTPLASDHLPVIAVLTMRSGT